MRREELRGLGWSFCHERTRCFLRTILWLSLAGSILLSVPPGLLGASNPARASSGGEAAAPGRGASLVRPPNPPAAKLGREHAAQARPRCRPRGGRCRGPELWELRSRVWALAGGASRPGCWWGCPRVLGPWGSGCSFGPGRWGGKADLSGLFPFTSGCQRGGGQGIDAVIRPSVSSFSAKKTLRFSPILKPRWLVKM